MTVSRESGINDLLNGARSADKQFGLELPGGDDIETRLYHGAIRGGPGEYGPIFPADQIDHSKPTSPHHFMR
jgi:hypothetical protein